MKDDLYLNGRSAPVRDRLDVNYSPGLAPTHRFDTFSLCDIYDELVYSPLGSPDPDGVTIACRAFGN